MYFTEDGSSTDGVHARYTDGTDMTLFRAIKGGIHSWEETVGIALSPNNMNLYAGYQSRRHIGGTSLSFREKMESHLSRLCV